MLINQWIAKFQTNNMDAYCFCLYTYIIKLLLLLLKSLGPLYTKSGLLEKPSSNLA